MKRLLTMAALLAALAGVCDISGGDPFDVGDKCPTGQHYEWRTIDVDGTPVSVAACVED